MRSTFVLLLISVAVSAASVIEGSKVVGGSEAVKGDFPYVVSLKLNGQFFCAGVIYNENHIMTTASCLFNKYADEITVTAGDFSLSSSEAEEQRIKGSQIVPHPDFDVFSSSSDIAFIQLASRLTFNKYVNFAPIAGSVPPEGTTATLVGWGSTQQGGQLSNVLRKNPRIPIRSLSDCAYVSIFNEAYMFCAGGGGNEACTGDAGSPLVNSMGEVVGLVSYIKSCSSGATPSIYTKLPAFSDWIGNNGGSQPTTTSTTTSTTTVTTSEPTTLNTTTIATSEPTTLKTTTVATSEPTTLNTTTVATSEPTTLTTTVEASSGTTPLNSSAFFDDYSESTF